MKHFIPIVSAILFLLLGCATAPTPKLFSPPEDMGAYIRLFESYAKLYDYQIQYPSQGIKVLMSTEMSDEILGQCYVQSKDAIVTFNAKTWAKLDAIQREMLVMHELGHCVLNLPHDASKDEKGRPTSIMHPSADDPTAYYRCTDCFIKNLFAAAKAHDEKTSAKDVFKHVCRRRKK
jgi:hypothetical protein